MKAGTTRVYLVRHGATVLTAEDRFAGATNVQLSDEGRNQARGLARRLAQTKIGAVYASPMDRTVETATIVAEPHGLEVKTAPGLKEISARPMGRLTRKEVEQRFPEEAEAWDVDPYTFSPEGGESGLAVTARALPVLIGIVQAHPGEGRPRRLPQSDHPAPAQLACSGSIHAASAITSTRIPAR